MSGKTSEDYSIQTGAAPIPSEKSDPDAKPAGDDSIIDFEGPDDPLNALNWPFRKKIVVTVLYSFCTMGTTWASTM